jgi:hypothetical protein
LSAPDRIRTCDLRFRRPTLYPAELRALGPERVAEAPQCRHVLTPLTLDVDDISLYVVILQDRRQDRCATSSEAEGLEPSASTAGREP